MCTYVKRMLQIHLEKDTSNSMLEQFRLTQQCLEIELPEAIEEGAYYHDPLYSNCVVTVDCSC